MVGQRILKDIRLANVKIYLFKLLNTKKIHAF